MKFNDETKEVKEFDGGDWFEFGVHKVQIALVTLDKTEGGKEFIEVEVVDPENSERHDTARVWFTTPKAANYGFNTLRSIYVHNAPEDKKDEARATIDQVSDTTELAEVLTKKLVGGECWFTKYYDAERTYEAKDGTTKRSVNKNIYSYEPKVQPELMPEKSRVDHFIDAAKKEMPGTKEVPFASASDAPGSKVAGSVPKDW